MILNRKQFMTQIKEDPRSRVPVIIYLNEDSSLSIYTMMQGISTVIYMLGTDRGEITKFKTLKTFRKFVLKYFPPELELNLILNIER